MTVVAYIACDEPGCDARADGVVTPAGWTAIVFGPLDDSYGPPASQHFCPEHGETQAALDAVRAAVAARTANE